MRGGHGVLLVAAAIALIAVAGGADPAHAKDPQTSGAPSWATLETLHDSDESPLKAVPETLWIFDADFEDVYGDNAGWTVLDKSGELGQTNYWHKDTLRVGGFPHLGGRTWWCGKYDPCWLQPRGYGNGWFQILSRDFPLSEWSAPGDAVTLEWDQRYAMERMYDFGNVQISTDGGATWLTLETFTNTGFMGAGIPVDWDNLPYGHWTEDLSAYAATDVWIRFLFTSDANTSSQDTYDNPQHSLQDGAWQIDNITWSVNGDVVWYDDCESVGDNGWVHDDIEASGQTGVTFFRGEYGVDFWTNRLATGGDAGQGDWMYAAVDTVTSRMVDGEHAWLVSPPIKIEGAPDLACIWTGWFDFPLDAHDFMQFRAVSADDSACLELPDEEPCWAYGGPYWALVHEDMRDHVGRRWLRVAWTTANLLPPGPGAEHMAGLFLDRFRLGVPLTTSVPNDGPLGLQSLSVSPNPFNPATTIEYALAERGKVTIRIVDVAGRVVRTLLDCEAGPGPAELVWDGTTDAREHAASGVYFVVMEVGGKRLVRKAVLLK